MTPNILRFYTKYQGTEAISKPVDLQEISSSLIKNGKYLIDIIKTMDISNLEELNKGIEKAFEDFRVALNYSSHSSSRLDAIRGLGYLSHNLNKEGVIKASLTDHGKVLEKLGQKALRDGKEDIKELLSFSKNIESVISKSRSNEH